MYYLHGLYNYIDTGTAWVFGPPKSFKNKGKAWNKYDENASENMNINMFSRYVLFIYIIFMAPILFIVTFFIFTPPCV